MLPAHRREDFATFSLSNAQFPIFLSLSWRTAPYACCAVQNANSVNVILAYFWYEMVITVFVNDHVFVMQSIVILSFSKFVQAQTNYRV